jgi:DNA/RNA endonuclease G (NUC1)
MVVYGTVGRSSVFGSGAIVGFLCGQIARYILPLEDESEKHSHRWIESTSISTPHYPPDTPLPSVDNVFDRSAYTCSINLRTKIPNWVAEHLNRSQTELKNGERKKASFRSDEDVKVIHRAHNKDYWDSGWSRGHLAAAASHRTTQEAQNSTFLLNSNIVPQDLSMNGCDWNRVEVLVRDLAKEFDDVYVLSGPLWVPENNSMCSQRPFSKNMVILHEVVGEGMVHVPTHLFKIIHIRHKGKQASVAFVLPNKYILEEKPLESYETSFEELEKLTGLDLSGMRASDNLCELVRCDRKENRRMRGWRLYGNIDDSRSIDGLRDAVRLAIDEGFVDGDNFLIPKIIKDRMIDLRLQADPLLLFPDEERYRTAVERGFANFQRRSIPSDAKS